MIFINILILCSQIFAQDIEPVSMSFTYKSQVLNIEQERFQQQNFFMGWQWSGHKKMINAMGTNVIAGNNFKKYFEWENYETTNYILAQPGKDSDGWNFPMIQAAAWLQFEPALKIPDNEKFVTISDDPSNPIFGFKYISEYGAVTFTNDFDDSEKKHYRLALYQDNFSSSTQSVVKVLSDPWPDDKFLTKQIGAANRLYSGRKWYLTLNLRRTSSSFNGYSSTLSDDTPVLSIVLPYDYEYLGDAGITGGPGTEQIKFLELPESNLNNISNWYSAFVINRPIGQYIPVQQAPITSPISRTLTITREMIPNWLDQYSEPVDINIFATYITDSDFSKEFSFDDASTTFHNPRYTNKEINYILSEEDRTYTPFITKQNIEVYYHKTLDIAIDWIRIGNDTSHELLTGKFENGTGSLTFSPYGWNGANTSDEGFTYIQPAIQGFLNNISTSSYTLPNNNKKYELFRILIADSESENPIWWGMLRYGNLITDGLAITRDQGYYHPKRYYHYTKAPNRYLGFQVYHSENSLNMPFLSNHCNIDLDNSKTLSGGYNLKGFNIERNLSTTNTQTPLGVTDIDFGPGVSGGSRSMTDTLYSDYETGNEFKDLYSNTKLYKSSHGKQFASKEDFMSNLTGIESNNLLKWEWSVNLFLYSSKDVLYDEKNWWMNLFLLTNIDIHNFTSSSNTFKENYPNPFSNEYEVNINTQTNKGLGYFSLAPKTPEILRRMIGTSLILGAKGILSDKDHHYIRGDETIHKSLSNMSGSRLLTAISYPDEASSTFSSTDDWGFIKQTEIGGDFTNPSHSGTYTGDIDHINLYLDPELVKRQFKVKEDRVYIGYKSVRTEMKKQFEWIKLNEDELMNLDLISWYTRSFFEWENQHPYFGNTSTFTYGHKYFKLNDIRTKKLYQPSLDFNHNYNPLVESKDSSFFDITILKPKETPLHLMHSSNTFYVGIQNRRTDPLILNKTNSTTSTTFQEVQFYSGAEFDDYAQNGGYDIYDQFQSSTWWTEKWWERFGAREIILPLNLKPYGYGKFVTFTDLGYDKYEDDPDNWFLTEPYNHVIDTILNYSNSLHVKLLPGQFKILKGVQQTVFTGGEECYVCDLVDDFDAFNLVLEPVGTPPQCCWDVKFVTDFTKLPPDKQGCTFTDIPIKLTIDGSGYQDLNAFISGSTFSSDASSKSYKFSSSFSTSGTISVGSICYLPNPYSIKKSRVSVLFGKDTLDSFIGCNRRIFDDVLCVEGEEEETESCCEKIGDVSSSYTPDPYKVECCTDILIDENTDSECIYSVALELYPDYWYDINKSTGNSLTFSDLPSYSLGKKKIGEFCQSWQAGLDCETVIQLQRDLLFLGADGEIICKKPITIYSCCENLGGVGGGGNPVGQAKHVFEIEKEKTFKEVISPKLNVKIIPNPNDGNFKIEFDNKIKQEIEIEIINSFGISLLNFQSETYSLGYHTLLANIENISSGLYYVRIKGTESNIVIPVVVMK